MNLLPGREVLSPKGERFSPKEERLSPKGVMFSAKGEKLSPKGELTKIDIKKLFSNTKSPLIPNN